MKSGILVVRKSKNITSREVVNQVGKIFHTKKVGHMGTLDPLAEGVLVLGINQGTKVIELLSSSDKEYVAEVIMGMGSDTLDVTGVVMRYPLVETYEEESVRKVLMTFLGSYNQEVPLYSAVHVEGKRLYEYARGGEEVTLPSKMVTIQKIELLEMSSMDLEHPTFKFKVSVSKGTYIRSLIRDIGKKLNCPCIMKNLLRTRQGKFLLEEAISLEEIEEDTPLLKIEDALKRVEEYDTVVVDRLLESKIRNGAVLPRNFSGSYAIFLNEEQELLAIYQKYSKDENLMKPWKVFCKENEK